MYSYIDVKTFLKIKLFQMFWTVGVSWFNFILNGKAVDLRKVYGLFLCLFSKGNNYKRDRIYSKRKPFLYSASK